MPDRSPTTALLLGLVITLLTVVGYSWYISGQISGLRRLQTDLADRNRRDTLQLLRVQNDLNQLGLAMRDMLDREERYPIDAWSAQFARIRQDLDAALKQQEAVAFAPQTPEQRQYLAASLAQFWDASDRIFDLARSGQPEEARAQIQLSLQARQAALNTAVARLLVQNNEREEQTARQVQDIYSRVQRQVYVFLAVTLAAIVATSLYLIRSNRQLFARLATLSNQRRELAQTLIATRESTLREIARELHDELGQLLTAMGSMLGRAMKHTPDDSPLRADLREVGEVAQTALDNVRGLSQTLHPSILEELGLDSTIAWYLPTVERQLGVKVTYDRTGAPVAVDATVGIHVYRVLQEALSNVAKHSGTHEAWVRLSHSSEALELEIEDHGRGLTPGAAPRGLGVVAMRERAALLGGSLEFVPRAGGGTIVRLCVPVHATVAIDDVARGLQPPRSEPV
jgi:signal transduction histidine kinase